MSLRHDQIFIVSAIADYGLGAISWQVVGEDTESQNVTGLTYLERFAIGFVEFRIVVWSVQINAV